MIIRLDFENETMLFQKPIKVLRSETLHSIEQNLQELEQFSRQGYYVVGYLAYESSQAFNSVNKTKDPNHNKLPLLLFGVFENFSVPSETTKHLVDQHLKLKSNASRQEYNNNIVKIRQEIKQGNTYQINYTIQFNSQIQVDALDYYLLLQKNSNANYCTYIEFDEFKILSFSPELFFKLNENVITTKPMKGTAGRGKNIIEDKQKLMELFSEKNQAENMMIVDLLRNDLSRISQTGTVEVTKLFEAEKYPTVWQLTSTIQSKLKTETSLFKIFQALFPCGSITGAPKASSMKIIAELEKQNREVYCGTIGYITPYLKRAVFNIPIRTLTISGNNACYGVGGGITWDSTEHGEYNEVLEKIAILSKPAKLPDYLIETLLLDNGNYFLLDEHLARLTDSAQYFDFKLALDIIRKELLTLAELNKVGQFKVRLTLTSTGKITLETAELIQSMQINLLQLAPNPVITDNIYLYHKTANREHFPPISIGNESLCYNQKGEVTEFVNGNIVLLIDDKWCTPKLDSGLLAGIMRANLVEQGKITEQTVLLTDVCKADKIAFINSVRGWINIEQTVLDELKRKVILQL